MISRRQALIGAGAGVVILSGAATASGVFGLLSRDMPAAPVFAVDGVAIRGTDPVAYFDEGRPMEGDPAITAEWRGATWRFTTADRRDRFKADPEAFAPQYGGFCAWAIAAKGRFFPTQPKNWSIVDGRLFLNYDDDVQSMWEKDRARFIAEADRRWPELLAGS